MEEENHKIIFEGLKPSKSLVSFIRHRIQSWTERQQSLLFLPKENNYLVRVEKDEEQTQFVCQVRIKIGSREWNGLETGRTFQDAVQRALDHIRPSLAMKPSTTAA